MNKLCAFVATAASAAILAAGLAAARATAEPVMPGGRAPQERYSGASVDVIAATPDERWLACSAATHALELLNRCGITLRRPLQLEIMNEVRHPLRTVRTIAESCSVSCVSVTRGARIPE
jgi:hypothetical protein